MSQALVTGLNGLSYAFILFLLAAGFSLTFGVMGVLNLAHGALYMLGAYIGIQIVNTLDLFWLAIIVAAAALAVIGYALYAFFLKRLYGRVPEQGVLTIGSRHHHRQRGPLDLGAAGQDHADPGFPHGRGHHRRPELPHLPALRVRRRCARPRSALVHPGQDARRRHHPGRDGQQGHDGQLGHQLRPRQHARVPARHGSGRCGRSHRGAHHRGLSRPWATTSCCSP